MDLVWQIPLGVFLIVLSWAFWTVINEDDE